MTMEDSRYLKKGKQLLASVQGRSLSVEERREMAIELGALMLNEGRRVQTHRERKEQAQIARMLRDEGGRALTTALTDQCFRSRSARRTADQVLFLIKTYGIPRYLSYGKQLKILMMRCLGKRLPRLFIHFLKKQVRSETAKVVIPGEKRKLVKHLKQRHREGVRVNLNHLGEAVLGEEEAERRLQQYIDDLARPEVECISVKISNICSQINLIAWEETLEILVTRLKSLYRAASHYEFIRPDGKHVAKFVNLDMEAYEDLQPTVEAFKRTLDDPEFHRHSAGIALQSYLPDTYLVQQGLTVWAMQRVASGGAPIKIRIVKGANLAMEKLDAALHCWQQAPYGSKADVDANFKRMVHYASIPENAAAVHVGVGSHNLLDIAYVMILRAERGVERFIEFEMLEGMASHISRVVHALAGDLLLYCPVAKRSELPNAIAYLVRRLDENTAPGNFLHHMFHLMPGTKQWQKQANLFSYACHNSDSVGMVSNRTQNRFNPAEKPVDGAPFANVADTDWTQSTNKKWAQGLLNGEWKEERVPLVIAGEEIYTDQEIAEGKDPSRPGERLYTYTLADSAQIDRALECATRTFSGWSQVSAEERSRLGGEIAQKLRSARGELIRAMVADTGKTVSEADVEISEAIDFAEYYRRNLEELNALEGVVWKGKGTVLVAPPWNFPCSIPLGGVVAALLAGNCVLFKPAPEAVLVGWVLAKLCWEAGISREVLQFIACEDEPIGTELIKDTRLTAVVLTGAAETARHLLRERPGLDLMAEAGGKNALIVTAMADRDLVVKDLIHSAFGHAGQKCSACSLAILEAEVYDDAHFREQLRDAAASLAAGSAWNLTTELNPLIRAPDEKLLRGLTQLEEGEKWLLEPKQDPYNPNLWSPGIKLGVKKGSFTHQNELFGPVLGIMRTRDLDEAIVLANGTPYGLTSGIHTLDVREQKLWQQKIVAGNLYINRGITGAIVQRQPFGGCKASSFGPGKKAGGPNYLMQLMQVEENGLCAQVEEPNELLKGIRAHLKKAGFTKEQLQQWDGSIGSYAHAWKEIFSQEHDPSQIPGQKNLLRYIPYPKVVLRVDEEDDHFDVLRVIAAAITCGVPLEISGDPVQLAMLSRADWVKSLPRITIHEESIEKLAERVTEGTYVRLMNAPAEPFAETGVRLIRSPVVAHGRVELTHYVREVAISHDTHRYGHLQEAIS